MQRRKDYCMIMTFQGSLLMTCLDLLERKEGHLIGKENKIIINSFFILENFGFRNGKCVFPGLKKQNGSKFVQIIHTNNTSLCTSQGCHKDFKLLDKYNK